MYFAQEHGGAHIAQSVAQSVVYAIICVPCSPPSSAHAVGCHVLNLCLYRLQSVIVSKFSNGVLVHTCRILT